MTTVEALTERDFPVTWRTASDSGRLWTQDRLHYPDPITPLEFSLIEDGVDAGLTKGAQAYGLSLTVHDRHINTYLYTHVEAGPIDTGAPAFSREPSLQLEAAMGCLRSTWNDTWLPEIQSHLAWWAAFPYAEADGPALLRHLEETEDRWQRLWEIHFLLFVPAKLAISEFADLYAEVFEGADPFKPYGMMAGYFTKTIESGQWLWEMSRRIQTSPEVIQVFREQSATEVIPRLHEVAGGSEVLRQLNEYLVVHGRRADKLSLDCPYWVDDPAPVVQALKQYLLQADRDLVAELAETGRQREELVAELRSQLQDLPRAVRTEVLDRLKAAQEGAYLSEEHGYWIDYGASYRVRQVLLAIGDRFVAGGVLPQTGDLFYLQMDEVKALLASAEPRARFCTDFEPLVRRRRRLADRFAGCVPPLILGDKASALSGPVTRDPVVEMFHKVEGRAAAPSVDNVIVGTGGSPGTVQGTVKVISTLQGAVKLEPGDILVADTTSPPWTLLFATAGGLVTNSGGILSHSAVIAREYGIPAVLGAGDATVRLHDGQRVEVDGTHGIVRILE
jgi:pyruvate,water dikinase